MNFFLKPKAFVLLCFFTTQPALAEISRDLDFNALFTSINFTQSDYGKNALITIFTQPTSDITVLKNRQAAIAQIADDAHLQTHLQTLLKAFNKAEPHLESIMQPANGIETATLEPFYFSSAPFQSWNYSPAGLELGQIAHFGNLCSSMAQHALAYAIFTWGLEEEHVCAAHPAKKHSHHDRKPDHKKDEDKHDHAEKKDKHKEHKHAHGETCNHHSHDVTPHFFKTLAQSKQFRYAFHVWHAVAQVQEAYSIQAIVRAEMQSVKQLQVQLINLAYAVKTLKLTYILIKDRPELVENLTHYKQLENIFTKSNISEKLNALLKLLEKKTFHGNASVFSRIGNILAAYKLAQEVTDELTPAFAAMGELDAYASCAKLLTNNQQSSLRYSFAQYSTESSQPLLSAHNFWHPLITNELVQLNSICLGNTDNTSSRNIVLTGPNACGKSTTLKALTICAYYAQTITVVPAEQYNQTLYKEIYSSIVVADDIQKNKSLFVAELTDAEELLTRVENLGEGEYMLIALDELFKSTHHEKGEMIAFRLLENLYASPQVITIVSTHFEKLIELAYKNSNSCTNYTVNDFTLEQGVGSSAISLDDLNAPIKSRLL